MGQNGWDKIKNAGNWETIFVSSALWRQVSLLLSGEVTR